MPSIFLMRSLTLSSQPGPVFFLLADISNASSTHLAGETASTTPNAFPQGIVSPVRLAEVYPT